MTPVYSAGWQLTKVRGVMLLSVACAVLSLMWGLDLARTYGLDPGDGGVLRPLVQRLAAATIVGALGLAFATGMWLFGRCYAARIDFDLDSERIHLSTVGFWGYGRHVLEPSDIRGRKWHHGQLQLRSSVDAPWLSVRLAGRRLPLIIDGQGVVLDKGLMTRYFGWTGIASRSSNRPASKRRKA